MRLALHVHYQPFSVTEREPQTLRSHLSTKEQETSCVKLVHIVSIVLSSYINVCTGYMCFVKLQFLEHRRPVGVASECMVTTHSASCIALSVIS